MSNKYIEALDRKIRRVKEDLVQNELTLEILMDLKQEELQYNDVGDDEQPRPNIFK